MMQHYYSYCLAADAEEDYSRPQRQSQSQSQQSQSSTRDRLGEHLLLTTTGEPQEEIAGLTDELTALYDEARRWEVLCQQLAQCNEGLSEELSFLVTELNSSSGSGSVYRCDYGGVRDDGAYDREDAAVGNRCDVRFLAELEDKKRSLLERVHRLRADVQLRQRNQRLVQQHREQRQFLQRQREETEVLEAQLHQLEAEQQQQQQVLAATGGGGTQEDEEERL